MKNSLIFGLIAILAWTLSSCVSTKKYTQARLHIGSLRADSVRLSQSLEQCRVTNNQLNGNVDSLNNRLNQFITAAKSQISTQKNAISDAQARIAEQQKSLSHLQEILDEQRAITQKLHQSISQALMGFDSDELTVTRKNGKVYISLQEKLLFKTASARVGQKGRQALEKVANVLKNNKQIQIDVEGHTDSIPISGRYKDNWALSLDRAASVVRILTQTYGVNPTRVIASGHSTYNPVASNETEAGRAHNRRTDIILSPNLDELYKLINKRNNIPDKKEKNIPDKQKQEKVPKVDIFN